MVRRSWFAVRRWLVESWFALRKSRFAVRRFVRVRESSLVPGSFSSRRGLVGSWFVLLRESCAWLVVVERNWERRFSSSH